MAIEYLKRGISDQKRSEDDANTAKIVSQTLLDICLLYTSPSPRD